MLENLDLNVPYLVTTAERIDIEPNITSSITEGNHNFIESSSKNSKDPEVIYISDDDDDNEHEDEIHIVHCGTTRTSHARPILGKNFEKMERK